MLETLPEHLRHLIFILGAEIVAFSIAIVSAKPFIRFLEKKGVRQDIREQDVLGGEPQLYRLLHLKKKGTPTMGGILIWGTVLLIVAASRIAAYFGIIDHSLLNRKETYLPIFALVVTALLGLVDDYLNIHGKNQIKGMKVRPKMMWLTLVGALGAYWFYEKLGYNHIWIPGFGDVEIGWWYIPLFIFIVIASANAVNITDGLDGLAAGLLVIAFSSVGVIAYTRGLLILTALCAVIVGATLAFLWFNIHPAAFYMGDTGALSLGATLGVIAMLTDTVILLPLFGFIFVIETLSVIAQLISKKYFKKKIFSIAPLHHHFEHKGIPECTITMRFWVVGGIVASLGLLLWFSA